MPGVDDVLVDEVPGVEEDVLVLPVDEVPDVVEPDVLVLPVDVVPEPLVEEVEEVVETDAVVELLTDDWPVAVFVEEPDEAPELAFMTATGAVFPALELVAEV